MNKKLIAQIVVIVIAFGAAGLILYDNGVFGGGGGAASIETGPTSATAVSPQSLMPYGSSLNFSALHSQGFVFDQVQYPQLNPSSDVGIPTSNLMVSPPSAQ